MLARGGDVRGHEVTVAGPPLCILCEHDRRARVVVRDRCRDDTTAAQAITTGVYAVNQLFEIGLHVEVYRTCLDDLVRRRRTSALHTLDGSPETIFALSSFCAVVAVGALALTRR